MLSQQKKEIPGDIDQVLLHGKICEGIHLSRQQRSSYIDNFLTKFSSRSSLDRLDPLLISLRTRCIVILDFYL